MLITSGLVAVACVAVLLATSSSLPMAWDEGNAILRAQEIPDWWPYTIEAEGHPAFYGMVIAAGSWVSSMFLEPLNSARLGPMVLFGLAAGAMFCRMWREYSLAAGFAAVAALMLMPRMFAHAHFASFDGPLVSCWILAWATFMFPTSSPNGKVASQILFGIALGMTLSCKATGWIAPLPFVVWALLYRDRGAIGALILGLPVALFTFLALNPPLWDDPLLTIPTFFELNFGRADQPGLNISTWFLGQMYNLDHPLPWYNTLVWTAISVPIGTLLLAAVGLVSALRNCRMNGFGVLIVLNWLVLLIVRALPGVPPHDGVRLFLPSFAFLAALAGVGCAAILAWAFYRWQQALAITLIGLLFAGSACSMVLYAPNWLSFYNLSVAGLPGATALGMEPTYYWDALDGDVLDWLHEHTPEDDKVKFAAGSPENLKLMRRWGILRRETEDYPPGEFRWYVVQNRPSGLQPTDLWLIENTRPVYRKMLFGVPLVEVYDYADHERAEREQGAGD